jgi:hypothetical protein
MCQVYENVSMSAQATSNGEYDDSKAMLTTLRKDGDTQPFVDLVE